MTSTIRPEDGRRLPVHAVLVGAGSSLRMMGVQRWILIAIVPLASSGCETLPSGRLWGVDATLAPGWEHVRASAVEAARDPWVWGPLLGAATTQVDD